MDDKVYIEKLECFMDEVIRQQSTMAKQQVLLSQSMSDMSTSIIELSKHSYATALILTSLVQSVNKLSINVKR